MTERDSSSDWVLSDALDEEIAHAAREVAAARHVVALTGAGLSVESGIPPFRGPGGLWTKYGEPPMDGYQRFLSDPAGAWRERLNPSAPWARALGDTLGAAKPNAGHQALAELERIGACAALITQNIDGLHQLAGSRRVVELHGTAREIGCLNCEKRFDAGSMVAQFERTGEVPGCPDCGGLMKHATVSFGQALSPQVIGQAADWSRDADFYLAMGSSLVVTPAADLPALARQSGSRLVIVNREATPLDPIADVVVHAAIGETLTQIENALSRLLPGPSEFS